MTRHQQLTHGSLGFGTAAAAAAGRGGEGMALQQGGHQVHGTQQEQVEEVKVVEAVGVP